jgi:succinoglycan biosynthesis transport protein ExoP
MELKQYVSVLWRWWWLIALSAAMAAGFSYYVSRRSPPIYQTATTLMVGQTLTDPNPQGLQIFTGQQLAQTYAQLVRHQPVMQAVVDTLGLPLSWEQVAGQTTAIVVPNTQLMEIRVIDTNPKQAQVIADEVARQLIAQSPTPTEKQQEEHRQFVNAQLTDLQGRIEQAKSDISDLEKSIVNESSARRIQDVQTQIAAKQAQLNTWQTNYTNLLTFVKGGTNYISVFEPATVPSNPIGPNTTLNVLVAAAIGMVLATGAAFLLEYLDDTIKSPDDVQRLTQLSTLGVISRIARLQSSADQLIAARLLKDPVTEAYRVLRTNLQFSGLKNPGGSLLVTSSGPGEGKTTTAANLSVVIAQTQKRVILVDADLRRPSIHKIFGLSNKSGLTSLVLDESLDIDDVVQATGVSGLRVLTSGPLPPNPAEVLNSPEMTRIIDRLREGSDLVIFDSPPALVVTDSVVLAGKLNSTLLIADAGRTRSDALRRSVDTLSKVNARVLGVVLNKMAKRNAAGYYYYYYDYSASGERHGAARWQFWRRGQRRRRKSPAHTPKSEVVN